ncbi:bidirectional sugar transporter SWEET17-like [Cryptomeria japonica]|uniref:bidirectional sugar transporter SWEET17-like n=1 Tax=Cryptomeria japonica TaxID=3369 RepID=UPI0027DA80EB|nr:bidirectional sugar transporter SWEET17-like [Cryptomeria japonica]
MVQAYFLETFYLLSFLTFAPTQKKGDVMRTKSVKYMSFLVSLFSTLNALVWSVYFIIAKDIFIVVPNGTGFLLGVTQLIVYLIYKSSEPILPISAELHKLPETKKIDDVFDLAIDIVEVEATNVLNVDAVNFIIDDQA